MLRKVMAVLVYSAWVFSSPALAGPGQAYPMGPKFQLMLKDIDLNKDQKQQLRELRETRQKDMKAIKMQVEQCREDLKSHVAQGADPNVLRESFGRLKVARNAAEDAHFELFLKTMDILSAEQKKILLQRIADRSPAKGRRESPMNANEENSDNRNSGNL